MWQGMLLLLLLLPAIADAQPSEPRSFWVRSERDSARIDAMLPPAAYPRPAVLLLADRFGVQQVTESMLKMIAARGYRAFALHLRSTPTAAVEGMPAWAIDSQDIALVVSAAVDLRNDSACTGQVLLLGFDVGAAVGALAQSRVPLFTACCLVSPVAASVLQHALPRLGVPASVHIGEFDGELTLARINEIREDCIDNGQRLLVRFYKTGRPFFYHPRHAQYQRSLTTDAWKAIFEFFLSSLR
jgi:dienelactone hydrolase